MGCGMQQMGCSSGSAVTLPSAHRRVVETPFPASLSVKRASFYLGNRRRRKGFFTVGSWWASGWLWDGRPQAGTLHVAVGTPLLGWWHLEAQSQLMAHSY